MSSSDHEHISRILNGDTLSFRVLVERYQRLAFSVALNILNNREEAEEVVQDAFMSAYNGLKGFRQEARFSTWFYCIVVRTALRKKGAGKAILKGSEPSEIQTPVEAKAESNLEAEDKKHLLMNLLGRLSPKERLILDLFYYHEQSLKEITTITGNSLSNVKVLLHRGRKRLAELIPDHLQKELTESL